MSLPSNERVRRSVARDPRRRGPGCSSRRRSAPRTASTDPGRHVERDAEERLRRPVADVEVLDLEQRLGHARSASGAPSSPGSARRRVGRRRWAARCRPGRRHAPPGRCGSPRGCRPRSVRRSRARRPCRTARARRRRRARRGGATRAARDWSTIAGRPTSRFSDAFMSSPESGSSSSSTAGRWPGPGRPRPAGGCRGAGRRRAPWPPGCSRAARESVHLLVLRLRRREGATGGRPCPATTAGGARGPGAPTTRCSRTVRPMNSSGCWNVRASPRLARACGAAWVTSSPRAGPGRRWVAAGPRAPPNRVDLPAPFGPTRPTIVPGGTSMRHSERAVKPAEAHSDAGGRAARRRRAVRRRRSRPGIGRRGHDGRLRDPGDGVDRGARGARSTVVDQRVAARRVGPGAAAPDGGAGCTRPARRRGTWPTAMAPRPKSTGRRWAPSSSGGRPGPARAATRR